MKYHRFSILSGVVLGAAIALTGVSAGADEAAEKAIKARKAQMQLYSWNLSALGAMAKGKVEYDAEAASKAAANLLALANLDSGSMWPQGSDSTAMPGKTRAKLEAWATYPKVAEKGKEFNEAAAALAEVAGNGLEALQGGVGMVGKTCGGCHKPFRDEE